MGDLGQNQGVRCQLRGFDEGRQGKRLRLEFRRWRTQETEHVHPPSRHPGPYAWSYVP